jgi:putative methyltransferase (TIGR04325 family)
LNALAPARALAKQILPDRIQQAITRMITPTTPAYGVSWQRIEAWQQMPPISNGHVDFRVMERPADAELNVPVVRDNLEALSHITIPNATVLDFGCGNGHYRLILSSSPHTSTWTYIGADSDPRLVDFCRGEYPGTRFEVARDGERLPFPDRAFDVVLASGVLQYCQHPAATLAELHRVTRTYVLVSRLPVWKYQNSQILMQTIRGAWGEDRLPHHIFQRGALETMMTGTGFSIVARDVGIHWIHMPGEAEPGVSMTYLLRKT